MESQPFFVALGSVALVFGSVLVGLPLVQVARGAQALERVLGLLISGAGFLAFGAGFALAHRGTSGLVLPGVVLTAIGYAWQLRASKDGGNA